MAQRDPTYADGSSSTFPVTVDDWGNEFQNNAHTKITAARWNQIADAVIALEKHTFQVMQTGKTGGLITDTGVNRPVMLYKVYTISVTGGTEPFKDTIIPGPAFTASEKAMFGGSPLASGSSVHIWIRKLVGNSFPMSSYQVTLKGPITSISGDAGIPITISSVGDDDWQLDSALKRIYIVTLLVTKG